MEELWLPDWENRHCPWCRELELLRAAATRLPEAPEWLRARIEVLDRDGGVEHDALWFLAGIDHPVLGNGSLLGPQGLAPLPTLFSLVVALQRLRSDPQEPSNPHFPDFRVFDPRNLRNFSEELIQAAVLRAVLPKEWGLTSQSKNLSETVVWGLSQTGGKVLLAEVLLAIARGALDPSLLARLAPYYADSFAETYKVLATAISR